MQTSNGNFSGSLSSRPLVKGNEDAAYEGDAHATATYIFPNVACVAGV